MFLSSCSSGLPVQLESQKFEKDTVKYSILFIIHGDGDYLYHDTIGNEYKADEVALAGAKRVAQQNPYAEMFIFHQRPGRNFLLFFPLRDGEFYYYRNGRLIANEMYWRDQKQSNFDSEVELYRRFRANNQHDLINVFLYYGHEIPEFGGVGYDASYPDRTFTIHDLASGLNGFARDSTRFDLTVLSTCFGGTPYTIGALGSFTRTIIASPDNLHLSYFDLHPLERLDFSLRDGDVPAFAKRFAQQVYDRLTKDIQTAVSVAVYDVDRVQEFLLSVHKFYDNTLTTLKGKTQNSLATIEHCDCAELPAYILPIMNEGVDVFYRPSHFGRSKNKQSHSGWECWKY
ncbi:MAG: hypothetical protein A2W11_11380 [Ignavibacteria bacterium RBG_16_35_7]|nr:MAG: hypothetical protein A2W11_11380 [Ignavibacteria bacterium RBG_16_35_7]